MPLRYLAFVVVLLAVGPAFLDGPPLAHTGGFGEPTCLACHFDGDLNDPSGSLLIQGLPERYHAGETYLIEIILIKPGMKHAGFQATLRDASTGEQAGAWIDLPDGIKVEASEERVVYAMHTRAGAASAQGDTARWQLRWKAPESAPEQVILHVAGNAADGDESPFGDAIYAGTHVFTPMH
ncbi:MAG: choice-of-anchor V domain-containing protein [Rhodothermales bacterium]|nr:choice-of-anchor V domain-containing protein [Rhodothermales bacterium]